MPDHGKPIRFCINNTRSLSEREWLTAQGCQSCDCLARCGPCFDQRFLMTDDDRVIEGESFEQILESLNLTGNDTQHASQRRTADSR